MNMADTPPNDAHFLNVLAGLRADQGSDNEASSGTLREGENGGKVDVLVDTESFGVFGEGVRGAVGILEGHLETIVTWKDFTVLFLGGGGNKRG